MESVPALLVYLRTARKEQALERDSNNVRGWKGVESKRLGSDNNDVAERDVKESFRRKIERYSYKFSTAGYDGVIDLLRQVVSRVLAVQPCPSLPHRRHGRID